jgi:hypothetical protein
MGLPDDLGLFAGDERHPDVAAWVETPAAIGEDCTE